MAELIVIWIVRSYYSMVKGVQTFLAPLYRNTDLAIAVFRLKIYFEIHFTRVFRLLYTKRAIAFTYSDTFDGTPHSIGEFGHTTFKKGGKTIAAK